MPDRKISQLTAGGAAQATDEYVIARSGSNFKITGANVAAAATSVGTLSSLTVSGNATFDTNTLFVDAANNRVGVGIASSLASVLHIKGPAGSNPATGGIVFQYSTNSNNYGAIGLDNASGSFAVLAGSGAELRFHTNSDLATSNLRWRMDTTGHLLAGADNSYDIGASGANRPRNVFVAGNVTAGGNLTAGNSISLSVNASGPVTISATNTSTNAAATARLELGSQAGNWYIENRRTSGALAFTFGTDRMLLDSSGNITAGGNINISAGNVLHLAGAGGNTYLQESSGTLFLGAGGAGRVQVNASGNVGVGVTPSAWISGSRALQVLSITSLSQQSNGSANLMVNAYEGATNSFNYIIGAAAFRYSQSVNNGHTWHVAPSGTANAAISFTQAMALDAAGNLGIGVTPSAWTISGAKAIQVGPFASLTSNNSGGQFTDVGHNIFGAYSYLTTAAASFYRQGGGQHAWYTAPSGTAGNAITFTQAMTLDASGNLLLGRTSQVIGEKFSSTGYGLFGGATVQAIIGDAGTGQVSLGAYSNHAVELRTNNTNRWQISSAGHLLGFVDNSYDIGASGATRPRTVYAGTSVEGGYIRAGAASAGAASTTTIGNGTATTVGAAGAASALPANPLGYIIAHVGTTQVKIPYYNN